jgi:hypothetical protein
MGWVVAQMRQSAALQAQVANLETEIVALQQRADAAQGSLATLVNEKATLQAAVNDLQTENASLRQQLENQNQMLASYQQPGSLTMAIGDATGNRPAANGTLTVDPATSTAVFVANNLAPLGETQVYQLWLIQGETPVSAGIFQVDHTGHGVLTIASAIPGTFDAMGVTIEPSGGSELPTLEQLLLLGRLSS